MQTENLESLFPAYEKVRKSGKWNMIMEADKAMLDMKLNPRHKSDRNLYFDIIKNYGTLKQKFQKGKNV